MQSTRGLWQDEAILLANFGMPLTRYFEILPFYDQAAPPLALVTLNALHALADGSVSAMRLLLLGLNLTLFAALGVAAYRRRDREVLLAIAIIAVTPLAVRYCVELKQYGFEIQASMLFLLALRWHPGRPGAVMLLAGILSFFSYSIMLVVGISLLDALIFRFRGQLAQRWFSFLAAYTVGWLACYILLFQPITALQTANYPDAYERVPLLSYLQNPRLIFRFQFIVWGQAYIALIGGLMAVLLLNAIGRSERTKIHGWGLLSLRADLWQPLRVLVGLMALVFLLWLAQLYPIASDRQFMFLMPIGALLMANLLLASAVSRQAMLIWPAVALMLVPSAVTVLRQEWNRNSDFQDTQGLYAFLKRHPETLILPDVLFEPTLRYYSARDANPLRHVDAWLLAETRPMESPQEALSALTKGNAPVYQHVWQPLISGDIFPAYAGWVVRHARGRGSALIGIAQVNDTIISGYEEAARNEGCNIAVAYRSRGVAALKLDCP